MAHDGVIFGTASNMLEVPLRSATTGLLLTGKAYGDMTVKYQREGAATASTVSVVTMTLGTWTSGGFVETQIAGIYQFGVPDAAVAAGVEAVTITFSTTGAIDVVRRMLIRTATRGMAGTALPAAAADAAGGLPISDAGGLDLDVKLANTNEITAARMGALTDWLDGGRLDLILDSRGTSTLTQMQVSGGAYDLTNATYVAALKAALGTIPASGNWSTHSAADVWAAVTRTLTVANWSTHSAADVWAVAARTLTANTNLGLPASWPASWPANWSWSTYDGSDTAGTTTLLTRIAHAITQYQIGGTGAWYIGAMTWNGEAIATGADLTTLTNKVGVFDGSDSAASLLYAIGEVVDVLPATWVVPGTLTAQQVRTELATELARMDAAVSTRLATSGYTAPPTVGQIDTQLTSTHGAGSWAGSGGTGGGAYTQTVTVRDGDGNLVANATVDILDGDLLIDTKTTVAGVAAPSANAGEYTLRVTKLGYASSSADITVSGSAARSVVLTAIVITPSATPDQSTGFATCYSATGTVEKGVIVKIRQTSTLTDGVAYDGYTRTAESDAAGLVEFPGMWVGCTYDVCRAGGRVASCTVPSGTSFALPDMIGEE